MTQVEVDKIIDRLKNACTYHRFGEAGVYAEYVKALRGCNYWTLDKAIDDIIAEDSRNAPPISALIKAYHKRAEEGRSGRIETKNTQYCDVCDDKGYIIMTKMEDIGGGERLPYQYVLYCPFCEVGLAQAWDGRKRTDPHGKCNSYVEPLTKYFDDAAIDEMRKNNREKRKQNGYYVDFDKKRD